MTHKPNAEKSGSSQFDTYSDTYNEAVNGALAFTGMKVDFFTRVKMNYLINIIQCSLPSADAANVLDVGCGVGNGHPLLVDRVGRLTGIDVSHRCIDRARDTNPSVEYATFEGINLPFDNESFDVVFAVSVFHHVPVADRSTLAREIRRVLRSSGLFVIFEHNPRNPLTARVVNNCEFDRDAILLDRRTSESLMATSGFRNIKTHFILTVPAQGRILRALDRLFAPLPIGAQYYTTGRVSPGHP
jgi:ubiquinone/menaquinone biosynthesis C-methylase UbiE